MDRWIDRVTEREREVVQSKSLKQEGENGLNQ